MRLDKHIKAVTRILYGLAILGILYSLSLSLFLAIMATDSPKSTPGDAYLAGGLSLLIFFPMLCPFPWYAARQLKSGKRIWPALVYSALIFFVFPFGALLSGYMVYVIVKANKIARVS